MRPSSDPAWSYPPGHSIDGWSVDRVLGRGGSATVLLCHDEDDPEVRVALKLLGSDTEDQRRRLEVLCTIEHPHIVRVRRARLDHQPPYLEMEVVDGTTVASMIAEGPLPVPRALDLFLQLADAVAFLHDLDIGHRDIKPENLIIARDRSLRIVDFGLARDGEAPTSYAPPECGDPGRDAKRWDVYSMGVVLYEMLTGRIAFPLPASGGILDRSLRVIAAKRDSPPLDPGPMYPEEIRGLVQRMTHPDPSRRVASAVELLPMLMALETWHGHSVKEHVTTVTISIFPLRAEDAFRATIDWMWQLRRAARHPLLPWALVMALAGASLGILYAMLFVLP